MTTHMTTLSTRAKVRGQWVEQGRPVRIRDHGADRSRKFRFSSARVSPSGETLVINVVDTRTGGMRSFDPARVTRVPRKF